MRRVAIGLVFGIAAWFGSAVAAEAQPIIIGPSGPLSVKAGATSTTYSANLTPGLPNVFDVQLKVYKNSEATPRYTSTISQWTTTGTITYSSRFSLSGWGLVVGDVLRFHLDCWWDPNGQLSSNDYSVTVTGS